jgi:hypothetical protein
VTLHTGGGEFAVGFGTRGNVIASRVLVCVVFRVKRWDDARAAVEEALRLNPADTTALRNLQELNYYTKPVVLVGGTVIGPPSLPSHLPSQPPPLPVTSTPPPPPPLPRFLLPCVLFSSHTDFSWLLFFPTPLPCFVPQPPPFLRLFFAAFLSELLHPSPPRTSVSLAVIDPRSFFGPSTDSSLVTNILEDPKPADGSTAGGSGGSSSSGSSSEGEDGSDSPPVDETQEFVSGQQACDEAFKVRAHILQGIPTRWWAYVGK